MKTFCIVGTDTEIGKTTTCCKIMDYLSPNLICSIKPIASGIVKLNDIAINGDTYELSQHNIYKIPYNLITPFCYTKAIAPHIAAKYENKPLSITRVYNETQETIMKLTTNYLLIEGVGGIMTPLNETETYLDLLEKWQYPIILVVGIKLGCINHALLSEYVIQSKKLNICGWIANQIDPLMSNYEDNLNSLVNKLTIPLLARINYNQKLTPTTYFKELFQC